MVMYPRNAAHHLQSLFAAFPVVVVTGARQVGRTTLLRQVFPTLDYVVFDASLDLEQARSEPELFLKNHPAPVILDEIQYAPELVASIKRAVDANQARPGQFLLTGSQQWQVLNKTFPRVPALRRATAGTWPNGCGVASCPRHTHWIWPWCQTFGRATTAPMSSATRGWPVRSVTGMTLAVSCA